MIGIVEYGANIPRYRMKIHEIPRVWGRDAPNYTGDGLKAKGHPINRSSVARLCSVARQLHGDAGERQIPHARVSLTQNMGGTGSSVVHILEVQP